LFASADGQDGEEDFAVSGDDVHAAIMEKHAIDFATDFTDHVFGEADTDASGYLTAEEIDAGVAAAHAEGLIFDDEVDQAIADTLAADTDGDALVSWEEFHNGVLFALDEAFGGDDSEPIDDGSSAPELAQQDSDPSLKFDPTTNMTCDENDQCCDENGQCVAPDGTNYNKTDDWDAEP